MYPTNLLNQPSDSSTQDLDQLNLLFNYKQAHTYYPPLPPPTPLPPKLGNR